MDASRAALALSVLSCVTLAGAWVVPWLRAGATVSGWLWSGGVGSGVALALSVGAVTLLVRAWPPGGPGWWLAAVLAVPGVVAGLAVLLVMVLATI